MVRQNRVFTTLELAVISEAVKQSEVRTEAKVRNLSWLMTGVVIVSFIGFITMIVMTATLIVDSFHINSTTYSEYSEKIKTLNDTQETSKILLETVQKNQERLEELYKRIKF